MLIAGIDEAGLGPALGVLSIAGSLFRVSEAAIADADDFKRSGQNWRLTFSDGDFFANFGDVKNKKAVIGDSKKIFPAQGIGGLELPILAIWKNWRNDFPANFAQFFQALGDESFTKARNEIPWYRHVEWKFPEFADRNEIQETATEMQNSMLKIVALRSRNLTAKELNRRLESGNKSAVAWKSVAEIITDFVQIAAGEKIVIVVDKQGGRNFYAPLVAEIFSSALVEVRRESPEWSEYFADNIALIFAPRADQNHLPTALASMLAKYIRERCMQNLNAWFAARIPNLRPTAGYHGDAPRFLAAVQNLLANEKIPFTHFWRNR